MFSLNGAFYGCLYRLGQPVALADEGTDPRRPFRLAGRYVIYSSQEPLVADEDFSFVSVVDLTSTHSLPVSYDAGPYRARLTALLVTRTAAFAFISRWTNPDGTTTQLVGEGRAGSHRNTTKLAEGTAIDPHSLRIGGGRVHWTEGGQPKSARLF